MIGRPVPANISLVSLLIGLPTIGNPGVTIVRILQQSFGPDFETTIETTKDGENITKKKSFLGLDIISKLFAVCGDSAGINDTMCDELLKGLKDASFDDYLDDKSPSKFHRRRSRNQ